VHRIGPDLDLLPPQLFCSITAPAAPGVCDRRLDERPRPDGSIFKITGIGVARHPPG